jgi:hypothetical protein
MRASAFCLAFLLFVASVAHGICPYPTPKVCAKYFESDAVFLGEVLKREYVSGPDRGNVADWIQYTIRVKEVYRGHADAVEKVLTGNDSASWYGEPGMTHVLFVADGKTSSTCGPLDEAGYVPEILRQIRALQNAADATIEGEVFSRSGGWGGSSGTPAPGIRLAVQRGTEEFDSVTDQDGRFSFLLPPGTYTLIGRELDPSDYSRQNVQHIKLEPGQCVQFQLLTKSKE